MTSRLIFTAVALATLSFLTACGGGDIGDDNAAGRERAASIGGIGGSGIAPNVGGIGGSGVAPNVGGIGGSGVAPNVGGIGGSGIAPNVDGIGGSAIAPNVGGIGGSGKSSITSVHVCGLPSAGITIAGARVNADAAADASSGGWVDVALAAPVRVDLDKLAAGAALPLDLSALPEGTYRQIRLLPAADDAANHAETPAVPTAAQGGLALAATITVAAGQASTTISGADVCDAVAAGATRVAAAE
jgi:hypothetical protein